MHTERSVSTMNTRDHILQVACRLFLQKNYDGVSIQDITKAVGMTKGALYHHFASKEQLFEEVARGLVGGHWASFSTLPAHSLPAFYTALVEGFRNQALTLQEAESSISFHNLLWDAARILPGFRASLESFSALEHRAWTAAVQAAIDRGELRGDLDAPKIARIFTAIPDGVAVTSMLKGTPALARYEAIQDLWDALYQSLKA